MCDSVSVALEELDAAREVEDAHVDGADERGIFAEWCKECTVFFELFGR